MSGGAGRKYVYVYLYVHMLLCISFKSNKVEYRQRMKSFFKK